MFKNACFMSAIIPIALNLNFSKIPSILDNNFGPEYKQSFKDGPVVEHDASKTALILVVSLSLRMTGL